MTDFASTHKFARAGASSAPAAGPDAEAVRLVLVQALCILLWQRYHPTSATRTPALLRQCPLVRGLRLPFRGAGAARSSQLHREGGHLLIWSGEQQIYCSSVPQRGKQLPWLPCHLHSASCLLLQVLWEICTGEPPCSRALRPLRCALTMAVRFHAGLPADAGCQSIRHSASSPHPLHHQPQLPLPMVLYLRAGPLSCLSRLLLATHANCNAPCVWSCVQAVAATVSPMWSHVQAASQICC